MDLGLNGTRAIVTGGSRGIGRIIAETLIAEGAHVAICGRNEETLDSAVTELGDDATGTVVDVVRSRGAHRLGRRIGRRDGRTRHRDRECLGARRATRHARQVAKVFETDVLSTVALVDAATPHLEASGIGSIVQLGTITAVEYHGYPGGTRSYGALKAALLNYTSQLAFELGPKKIRANSVSPGPIYIADGSWGFIENAAPDYFAENVEHHPQKRLGTPEEVARVVAFLASPAASWVTGDNVVVDGGFTRRHAF